jgi:copper chaperone
MNLTFDVHGMSCGHCVASITSAVSALPGVTGVDVVLNAGTVRVDGSPDGHAVMTAIEDAGYDVRTSS